MSGAGTALFVFCAFWALLSALGTIMFKSPIRAAMALLAHIVSLTGLFLTLHAHLLAALQLLVYAGAVVVLFVFVIMMLGPAVPEKPTTRGMGFKTITICLMFLFTSVAAAAVIPISTTPPLIPGCPPGAGAECAQFGGVQAFSQMLYVKSVVPFELIGILLTVAIVGAIAVARGRSQAEVDALKQRRAERQGSQGSEAKEEGA